MKFIRFPQAHAEIKAPGVGVVPYYTEGALSIVCVELSKAELKAIARQGGQVFLIVPVRPGTDGQPYPVSLYLNPFNASKPPINGKDKH